jgi:hypothetical protein
LIFKDTRIIWICKILRLIENIIANITVVLCSSKTRSNVRNTIRMAEELVAKSLGLRKRDDEE